MRRDHVEMNVVVDRLRIDLGRQPRKRIDRGKRGGKDEVSCTFGKRDRIRADAVGRKQRLAAVAVDYGERETAAELPQEFRAAA